MLYMVLERFRDPELVYARARAEGRMLPEGLEYIDSWVERSFERCYQLMRTDDPALLEQWADRWRDIVEFTFVPVFTSGEAAERIGDARR